MNKRISYEILALQMEQLWNKNFESADVQSINSHCEYMQNFIEACGWKIDDYIHRMMYDSNYN